MSAQPDAPSPTGHLSEINDRLKELVQSLYGDRMQLRIVDPKELRLLKKNPRYMPKTMFDQLTKNIRRDGQLESVPLCHTLADQKLEVLSGNHRVQAAVEAGVPAILVLVITRELRRGEKIAKQLSHNAIAGQDDQQLLAELWDSIDDIEEKLYSGLDSVKLGELTKVNFSGFGAETVPTEAITLWFIPSEVERIDALVERLSEFTGSKTVYLAPIEKYNKLFDLITEKKRRDNIKNTAVAFMALIDELAEHMQKTAPVPAATES